MMKFKESESGWDISSTTCLAKAHISARKMFEQSGDFGHESACEEKGSSQIKINKDCRNKLIYIPLNQ